MTRNKSSELLDTSSVGTQGEGRSSGLGTEFTTETKMKGAAF